MFVHLKFIVPLENFSLICRWRAANFDLCSALMAIELWGFFNVPHLLWHGLPFIIVISEDRLPLVLSHTVLITRHLLLSVGRWSYHYLCLRDMDVSRPGIEPRSPACEANTLPLRHRGGPQNKSLHCNMTLKNNPMRLSKHWYTRIVPS